MARFSCGDRPLASAIRLKQFHTAPSAQSSGHSKAQRSHSADRLRQAVQQVKPRQYESNEMKGEGAECCDERPAVSQCSAPNVQLAQSLSTGKFDLCAHTVEHRPSVHL
jgi:hypothetical protein